MLYSIPLAIGLRRAGRAAWLWTTPALSHPGSTAEYISSCTHFFMKQNSNEVAYEKVGDEAWSETEAPDLPAPPQISNLTRISHQLFTAAAYPSMSALVTRRQRCTRIASSRAH